MKKKAKDKKQQEMPEFAFKQFTPEESRIYEEAMHAYREALAGGKKLNDAYEAFSIADSGLRALIQADFLKVLIAERHIGRRQDLETVAKDLGVSPDLLRDTYGRMLQEVGAAAADEFVQESGGLAPSTDD